MAYDPFKVSQDFSSKTLGLDAVHPFAPAPDDEDQPQGIGQAQRYAQAFNGQLAGAQAQPQPLGLNGLQTPTPTARAPLSLAPTAPAAQTAPPKTSADLYKEASALAERGRIHSLSPARAGLESGVEQLKQLGVGAIAAGAQGLSDATGGKVGADVSQWAVDKYRGYEDAIKPYQEGRPTKIEDIHGLGDAGDYLAYTLGNVAPSIAQSLLSAGIGAAVGSAATPAGSVVGAAAGAVSRGVIKKLLDGQIAKQMMKRNITEQFAKKQVGEAVGAGLGMFGSSYVTGVGDVFGETMDENGRGNVASAFMGAVPYAALDAITDLSIIGKIISGTPGEKALKRYAKAMLFGAAKEGGAESAQEAVLLAAGMKEGKQYSAEEVFSRLGNSFAAGAVAGGVFGAPAGRQSAPEKTDSEHLIDRALDDGLPHGFASPEHFRQALTDPATDDVARARAMAVMQQRLTARNPLLSEMWAKAAPTAIAERRPIQDVIDETQQTTPPATPATPPAQGSLASAVPGAEAAPDSAPPAQQTTPSAQTAGPLTSAADLAQRTGASAPPETPTAPTPTAPPSAPIPQISPTLAPDLIAAAEAAGLARNEIDGVTTWAQQNNVDPAQLLREEIDARTTRQATPTDNDADIRTTRDETAPDVTAYEQDAGQRDQAGARIVPTTDAGLTDSGSRAPDANVSALFQPTSPTTTERPHGQETNAADDPQGTNEQSVRQEGISTETQGEKGLLNGAAPSTTESVGGAVTPPVTVAPAGTPATDARGPGGGGVGPGAAVPAVDDAREVMSAPTDRNAGPETQPPVATPTDTGAQSAATQTADGTGVGALDVGADTGVGDGSKEPKTNRFQDDGQKERNRKNGEVSANADPEILKQFAAQRAEFLSQFKGRELKQQEKFINDAVNTFGAGRVRGILGGQTVEIDNGDGTVSRHLRADSGHFYNVESYQLSESRHFKRAYPESPLQPPTPGQEPAEQPPTAGAETAPATGSPTVAPNAGEGQGGVVEAGSGEVAPQPPASPAEEPPNPITPGTRVTVNGKPRIVSEHVSDDPAKVWVRQVGTDGKGLGRRRLAERAAVVADLPTTTSQNTPAHARPGYRNFSTKGVPHPLSGYLGNKKTMIDAGAYDGIIQEGQAVNRVVEPFGGSGLLGNTLHAQTGGERVLNDLDPQTSHFHAQVKDNPDAVVAQTRRVLGEIEDLHDKKAPLTSESSQKVISYWKASITNENATTDPAERAARTLIRNNGATSVMAQGQRIVVKKEGRQTWNVAPDLGDKLEAQIRGHHAALKAARLTTSDARAILAEAGAGDLVPVDPPYVAETGKTSVADYAVGKDLTTIAGAVDFILTDVKAAAERGAQIIYTNYARPEIIAALQRAGLQTRIVHRRSQRGTKPEVIGFNHPVARSDAGRGADTGRSAGRNASPGGDAGHLPDRPEPGRLAADDATAAGVDRGERAAGVLGGVRGGVAPNGQPSNLTPEHQQLVRTPEFKAWFGDWENDPANASKVLDENGEPLLVYHGTQDAFDRFDLKTVGQALGKKYKDVGFWFADKKSVGQEFASMNPDRPKGRVIPAFLRMNKPYRWDRKKELQGAAVKNAMDGKYDGVVFPSVWDGMDEQHTQYQVFDPDQIESADGSLQRPGAAAESAAPTTPRQQRREAIKAAKEAVTNRNETPASDSGTAAENSKKPPAQEMTDDELSAESQSWSDLNDERTAGLRKDYGASFSYPSMSADETNRMSEVNAEIGRRSRKTAAGIVQKRREDRAVLATDSVKSQLETSAEPTPATIDSQEEWDSLFPGRVAQTPVGQVRIGENQYEKMIARDRAPFSGMVLPTLERPVFIFDDGNNGTVFVKSFQGDGGIRTFVSVAVGKDGINVVITNGPRKTSQTARRIVEAKGSGRLLPTRSSASPPEGFGPPPRTLDNNRPITGGLNQSLTPAAPENKGDEVASEPAAQGGVEAEAAPNAFIVKKDNEFIDAPADTAAYITQPTIKDLRKVKLGKGEYQLRFNPGDGEITVGYLTNTRESYGNNGAKVWETSDGERFAGLVEARAHEFETKVLPKLRDDGYLPKEGDQASRFNLSSQPRPTGDHLSAAYLQARLDAIVSKLKGLDIPIRVVQNEREALTPSELAKLKEARKANKDTYPKAIFRGHEIVIIANNVSSLKDAFSQLSHEGAHFSLRKVFGPTYDSFLDELIADRNAEVQAHATARGLNMRTLEGRREAADELMARLAERNDPTDLPFLTRVYQALRAALRAMGIRLRLSDGDLREILAASKRYLERGDAAGALKVRGRFGGKETGRHADTRFMFAGRKAKGADLRSLTGALRRIKAGEDAETVRKETGWSKDVDGKFKFEISDADAKWKEGEYGDRVRDLFKSPYESRPLGELLDHPSLFAAYPNLAAIGVKQSAARGGSFNQEEQRILLDQNLSLNDAMDEDALSILLHEIQHGIQYVEGFATGSNPSLFTFNEQGSRAKKDLEVLRDLRANKDKPLDRHLEELQILGLNGYDIDHLKWLRDIADEESLKQFATTGETPLIQYQRRAGEVEARNTQSRQRLTDAERKATPPSATADVADADVIVTFNGKEAASAPRPANGGNTNPDIRFSLGNSETEQLTVKDELTRRLVALKGPTATVERSMMNALGGLTTRMMADVSKAILPSAKQFVAAMQQYQTERNKMVDQSAKRAQTMTHNPYAENVTLMRLMTDSTVDGVDASQDRYVPKAPDVAAAKAQIRALRNQAARIKRQLQGDVTGLDVEALQQEREGALTRARELAKDLRADVRLAPKHKSLNARFKRLPAWAQTMYQQVRDDYIEKSERMEKAIMGRAVQTQMDAENRILDLIASETEVSDDQRAALQSLLTGGFYDLDAASLAVKTKAAVRQALDNAPFSAAIKTRIEQQLRSGLASKQQMVARVRSEFEAGRVEGVYFPLQRFGKYYAAFERQATDADGNPEVTGTGEPRMVKGFAMFDSEYQLNLELPDIQKEGWSLIKQGYQVETVKELMGASEGFVAEVVSKLVDTNNRDGADLVYQLYLDSLPFLSARKHFIHRKKILGYSDDLPRTYSQNMAHLANQIARMEAATGFQSALKGMKREADASEDSKRGDRYLDEFQKRYEWIQSPTGSKLSSNLTALGFFWHLGVSPAAALVNLTQTAIVAFPELAAKFGYRQSAAMLLKTLGETLRARTPGQRFSTRRDYASWSSLNADEREALAHWHEIGAVDVTNTHSLMHLAEGGSAEYAPKMAKMMEMSGFLFQEAEVVNREATLLAAYRLAKVRGMSEDGARTLAAEMNWNSHGDYSGANRARWMQGNVAKVMLQFKQYPLMISYYLGRNAWQSFQGEDQATKNEARKRLVGILGMTGLLAGSQGLPWAMTAPLFLVANVLNSLFGDDDDDWDAETAWRDWLADLGLAGKIMDRGAANALTGVDLASRVKLSDLWFREPGRELEGKAMHGYLLEQMAGPVVGGIGANLFRAASLADEGQYGRAAETASPKFIKDALTALRFASEGGANNMQGQPILSDLSPLELFMKANGFSPDRLSAMYDMNNAAKTLEQKLVQRRATLIAGYGMAALNGDLDGVQQAKAKIRAYNANQPALPIDQSALRRSLKAREKYREKADAGIYLNPKLGYVRELTRVPL